MYKQVIERLKSAYAQVLKRIGDPLDSETLYAPLHTQNSVDEYKETIERAISLGGKVEFGGKVIDRPGFYVEPTIITGLPPDADVVQKECFAPIVYCLEAKDLDQAIEWNNKVDQGLSSSLFTQNIASVFQVRYIIIILIIYSTCCLLNN